MAAHHVCRRSAGRRYLSVRADRRAVLALRELCRGGGICICIRPQRVRIIRVECRYREIEDGETRIVFRFLYDRNDRTGCIWRHRGACPRSKRSRPLRLDWSARSGSSRNAASRPPARVTSLSGSGWTRRTSGSWSSPAFHEGQSRGAERTEDAKTVENDP